MEMTSFIDVLLTRTIYSINAIISATKMLNIETDDSIEETLGMLSTQKKLTEELVPHVKKVWEDPGIQTAFRRRNEFQLDSNAPYYFENMDRFIQPGFQPTLTDILQVRQKTSGIMDTNFNAGGLEFNLVDVGGQRSERRKWLHCFDQVSAVIYFISLEEYNMNLSEDYRVNRLQEALDLFEEITSSEHFTKTHFFVLFNKEDLFKCKIQVQPISQYFDEFIGDDTYDNSLKFIQTQFERIFHGNKSRYTAFVTCTLDTDSVMRTMEQIQNFFRDNNHTLRSDI